MGNVIKYWVNLLVIIAIFAISSCANIAMPSGGPKDVTPPVFIKSEPLPASTHFSGKKLVLQFNEFINLSEPASKVTISPPVKTFPDFRTRGKSIIVEFKDSLKTGVTYNLDFGDCIQDITENNPFNDYRFMFSTGNQIDSMVLAGMTLNAFTQQAEKDVMLLLYRNGYDSIPYKEIPDFVAKSKADGSFVFSCLPEGSYHIFALKDKNGNLMYDPLSETIGFMDSLVISQLMPVKDTSAHDSLQPAPQKVEPLKKHILYMFDETDSTQRLLKKSAEQIGQFSMYFRWPVSEITYRFLKKPLTGNWHVDEYNASRDTLTCFLSDPTTDSLFIEISDKGNVIDTLELKLRTLSDTVQSGSRRQGKGGGESGRQFKFTITANAGSSAPHDLNVPLRIRFSHPLAESDLNRIQLQERIDSTGKPITARIAFTDTGVNRNLLIDVPWKSKTAYRLILPRGIFKDIYGMTNDSLKLDFVTREVEDYGVLKVNLKIDSSLINPEGTALAESFLFQLLNEKDVVLKEKVVLGKETLTFDYLPESNLKARIIFDANNNRKWDTGNYLQKKQAERIMYYPGIMKIKKNWDTEIDWIIK